MRVSYNWLKDYVEFDLSPEELAHVLTMGGLEVEGIEYLGEGIENVVVGQIKEITDHPNADKLVICRVDVGQRVLQIVTGAPNVKEGAKVALALVGAKLPNGMAIKKAKLRGVVSEGMVCSAQELGLDPKNFPEEQQEGIIIFPDDAVIGEDIKEILGLDDYVLELGLTPNRADCLAMVNVAREVAALTGGRLKLPEMQVAEADMEKTGDLARVEIVDEDLCHRYVARVIKDVTIKPSPAWMQQYLQAAGVRPINNIVDVTNFIMLELGQPLHAFDYDKLAEHRIVVRKAEQDEKIVTLDGEERQLDSDMLVIADAERPVAVAGVMGGLDTEVTEETRTILLEAAYFQGASVRRTSRKLGLRSESSARFERGIDKDKVKAAADRAAQLMAELGGGKVAPEAIDVYPKPWRQPVITLRCERVNDLLGTDISSGEMAEMLRRLHLDVTEREQDVLEVKVPSHRNDLASEVDLVEEIARLYGYGNIETTMPKGEPAGDSDTLEEVLQKKVTETLLACGLTEVITYSFISPKAMDRLQLPGDHAWRRHIEIQNPLTEEQSIMRTTLLPGLLDTAAKNFKRRQVNLQLFEIGSVFIPTGEKLPDERIKIGAVVSGEAFRGWMEQPEPMDFFYLKGIVEALLGELSVTGYEFKAVADSAQLPSLHPGRSAYLVCEGDTIGYIGEVHPGVLDNYGLQQRAVVMELDLHRLAEHVNLVPAYRPLPKFPAVTRDMAFVVPEHVSVAAIDRTIKEVGGQLLKEVWLFDVYQGKQIPEGHRSLAYSMTYQAEDRTLTDEEVSALHEKIQQKLQEKFQAKLR